MFKYLLHVCQAEALAFLIHFLAGELIVLTPIIFYLLIDFYSLLLMQVSQKMKDLKSLDRYYKFSLNIVNQ